MNIRYVCLVMITDKKVVSDQITVGLEAEIFATPTPVVTGGLVVRGATLL